MLYRQLYVAEQGQRRPVSQDITLRQINRYAHGHCSQAIRQRLLHIKRGLFHTTTAPTVQQYQVEGQTWMGQYGRGYWNDLMNGLIQTLQASSGANGVNWVGEPGGGGTKGETVGGQVSVRELKRLPALLLHYRDSTVA